MDREIVTTGDGSTTIHLLQWNEHYHSKHGAIQEAKHVFIQMGLLPALDKDSGELSILEIGFGTGLNALVTWQALKNRKTQVFYTGLEAYPVAAEEINQLNFAEGLGEETGPATFKLIHDISWELPGEVTNFFTLTKKQLFFQNFEEIDSYNLIYFDAFGARVQPELWTEEIFEKMFKALKKGGILVTYAAKGSVRRAMLEVGFLVERLPGPPGKREMLRATKP